MSISKNSKRRLDVQQLENRFMFAADMPMGAALPPPVSSPPALVSTEILSRGNSTTDSSKIITDENTDGYCLDNWCIYRPLAGHNGIRMSGG